MNFHNLGFWITSLASQKETKFVYFGKKREWDRAMVCIERSQNDVLAGNIEKGEVGHWFWPSWITSMYWWRLFKTEGYLQKNWHFVEPIGTLWSQWLLDYSLKIPKFISQVHKSHDSSKQAIMYRSPLYVNLWSRFHTFRITNIICK